MFKWSEYACVHVLEYWAIQRSWFARVNALCNLSCKKLREVAAHFRADFWVGVASRCVYQWKLKLIAKQYKFQLCCSCRKYRGKGMEVKKEEKRSVFASFFGWPEDREFVERKKKKKSVLGHPKARAASYCLFPDTFWLRWQCKIRKFTVTAFHCEESTHRK